MNTPHYNRAAEGHWSERARAVTLDMVRAWGEHGVQLCTGVIAASGAAAIATVAFGHAAEASMAAEELKRLGVTLGGMGVLVGGYGTLSSILSEKLIKKLDLTGDYAQAKADSFDVLASASKVGYMDEERANEGAQDLLRRYSSDHQELAKWQPSDAQSAPSNTINHKSRALGHSELEYSDAPR